MTFYERVNGLCKQKGVSITKLTQTLKFSKSAATTWKKSDNWPRNSTIKAIADYFGIAVDELTKGVDLPIDYEKYDTSDFNKEIFSGYLEKHKGNKKKAVKDYLAFEKQKTQDAMNDPDRLAIYQNNGGTVGVQGHAHAPVTINNGTERTLSDQEADILHIFAGLDGVERSKVILYAAKLREKKGRV